MITHKVVQKVLSKSSNQEVVSDRGAWKSFETANQQAIDLVSRSTRPGCVEVHELVTGTATPAGS